MTLQGTMSGFTVRKPTLEELTDPTKGAIIVHMTSDVQWDPKSATPAELEQQLRHTLELGFDLHQRGGRTIHQLQSRGQENTATVDLSVDLKPQDMPFTSLPLTGRSMLTQPAPLPEAHGAGPSPLSDAQGTDDGAKEASKYVSIKSLQTDMAGAGAIDVDCYADLLLKELGVMELGLDKLASKLVGVSTTKQRPGFVTAEKLAKNWKIGLDTARRTVDSTTQLGVRDFSSAGTRRLKPHHWFAKYNRLHVPMYTDTWKGQCKSIRGNTCCQIYSTDFEFVWARPLAKESEVHYSLDDLFNSVGVPSVMIPDNAKALTGGEFLRKCRRAQCPVHPIEAYTSNANRAEGTIREMLRQYNRTMSATGAPEVLWDYCLEWVCATRSHSALNIPKHDGRTPASKLLGDTVDISHLAEFGWYDWVWYVEERGKPALDDTRENSTRRKRLGRYLGPSNGVGSIMCGVVLTERGTTVDRTSIIPLSVEDMNSEPVKKMKEVYTQVLASKLKHRMAGINAGKPAVELDEEEEAKAKRILQEESPLFEPYEQWDASDLGWELPDGHDEGKSPLPELAEADDVDYDGYIGAKVSIPRDGHTFAVGRVIKRARDKEGMLLGKKDKNPLLDSSVYELEFENGDVEKYTANVIAEHIYSRVDADGTTVSILDEILEHKKDDTALSKEEGYTTLKSGRRKPKPTTRGWQFLVRLKDQSTNWVKLKDLKESNPLELAEYGKGNGLMDEPAFVWWAPFMIRKRDRMLKAMKTRYLRTTQKFGIELPKTVERAYEIDKETGTTFWADAIAKEMKTVKVAFSILEAGAAEPSKGRQFLPCHLVFDVKQGSLQRKARFVAKGCCLDTTGVATYASVVSRESVRIAFMLAALNGLDVMAADCEGAYLNAPPGEAAYTQCGPEFGEYKDRWAIIERALYGLASSANSWRNTISSLIERLGYKMCRADNDVWMRPAVNAAGEKIWEYVLVYSDDLLVLGLDPKATISQIDQVYKLKPESVKPPDQYLGADVGKMHLANGTFAWYMSSDSYCKAAIQNMEIWLEKKKQHLPKKMACVFPSN